MRRLQRHSRWIALAVVVAMVSPFAAQGLGVLMSVDPLYVAAALLLATVAAIALLARPKDGQEED